MSVTPSPKSPQPQDELQNLMRRAEAGDVTAVPALRKVLAVPGVAGSLGGDLAAAVGDTLLRQRFGQNLLRAEAVEHRMAELRAEIADEKASAIEKLLAERIVLCWLHLYQLELAAAELGSTADDGQSEFFQRSIDRAQKRYLSAIHTLATVRKLAAPVLQLNIARKQMNVAGVGVAPAE